jgi:hypothetical protein
MTRTSGFVCCLTILSSACLAADTAPAIRYLDGVIAEVASVKRDLPRLTRQAQQAADRLLAGGEFYAPPIAPWWASEVTGRAGGPMRVIGDMSRATERDVALFALPDPARMTADKTQLLRRAVDIHAALFILGSRSSLDALKAKGIDLSNCNPAPDFLGGPDLNAGLYPRQGLPPLAPYAPVIDLVNGWSFVGEVVGACTRQGRMPTIWQSIAVPGSRERNAAIRNRSGPQTGQCPFFHAEYKVAPLAPGAAGASYIETVTRHLRALKGQPDPFARAARWMLDARTAGHRVLAVAQGHSPALIVGLNNESRLPIEMHEGDFVTGVVPHARPGDTVIAFNYMRLPVDKVREVLARPCKVIIACPYGLPSELNGQPNLIWLDLGWKVGDAAVEVPGYDVKMLPVSAVVQMSALYALIAEMASLDTSLRAAQ